MSLHPNTPIIIGVGDIRNKPKTPSECVEPAELMLQACQAALADTGLSASSTSQLLKGLDAIEVVAVSTWPYTDLPTLMASKLGAPSIKHKTYTHLMGNAPVASLNTLAHRIATGRSKACLITGGETLASLKVLQKSGEFPPRDWTRPKGGVEKLYSPNDDDLLKGVGKVHGIGTPVQVYPLVEHGFRARRGMSLNENMRESARLYGDFAKVAEGHEKAWSFGDNTETSESIGRVDGRNRLIFHPYPMLMTAMPFVDLTAACILTSVSYARELGVSEEKWIFPLGGSAAKDSAEFYNRPNYHTSPSLSHVLTHSLANSSLSASDIDIYDFYSCFPIVPKLACDHLNLDAFSAGKPITLLGGLTSFGGAGADYSLHAIAEMVRKLRDARRNGDGRGRKNGLILANGGVLSCENAVVLSSTPAQREDGSIRLPYAEGKDVEIHDLSTSFPGPKFLERAPGTVGSPVEAEVETFTVEYNRGNKPVRGHVVLRQGGGERVIANHGDESTLKELSGWDGEVVGRRGWVWCLGDKEQGRNVFSFEKPGVRAKL